MKENIKIFFKGLKRTLSGSFVSALFLCSGYEFWAVKSVVGYKAAANCMIAIVLMICGVFAMFHLGGGRPAQGKYSK